jgi:hypothetical protein
MRYSKSILPRLVPGLLVAFALIAMPVSTPRAGPLGLDASTPGYSAKQILQSGVSSDGLYWIDPNGGSTADAFRVYADMTTAGGGWTLGLNSVFGDTSSTTDMVSNTGTVGIGTGHTREMTELAINQNAEIRHRLINKDGSVRFDGYYTGNYHGILGEGGWTVLAGGVAALGVHDGMDWSTAANDVDSSPGLNCAVYFGVPWYYTGCYNAIPVSFVNIIGGLFSQGSQPADEIGSWAIYVREGNTPAVVSEPGSLALFGMILAGLGQTRRRNRC